MFIVHSKAYKFAETGVNFKCLGFVTIEEGQLRGRSIDFKSVDIGRISFSRDLSVDGVMQKFYFFITLKLLDLLRIKTNYRIALNNFFLVSKLYNKSSNTILFYFLFLIVPLSLLSRPN